MPAYIYPDNSKINLFVIAEGNKIKDRCFVDTKHRFATEWNRADGFKRVSGRVDIANLMLKGDPSGDVADEKVKYSKTTKRYEYKKEGLLSIVHQRDLSHFVVTDLKNQNIIFDGRKIAHAIAYDMHCTDPDIVPFVSAHDWTDISMTAHERLKLISHPINGAINHAILMIQDRAREINGGRLSHNEWSMVSFIDYFNKAVLANVGLGYPLNIEWLFYSNISSNPTGWLIPAMEEWLSLYGKYSK